MVRIRAHPVESALPEDQRRLREFLAPRFWPTWLGLALMRLLVLLPFGLQLTLGRLLGRTVSRLLPRRRHIAATNLALCFPQKSPAERKALLRAHFESLGQGVFETAFTWWAPDRRLNGLAIGEGLEHITAARAAGRGVILLSAHFTTLEIGCRLLLQQEPFHPMYRTHENPLFERVMRASRQRLSENPIRRDDVRGLLRSLRQGHAVWYAPDQAFRGKNAADVAFFGVPAATNLSTTRLAQTSGAPVLPFFSVRTKAGRYRLIVKPALENFPGPSPSEDAARINALIEETVREAPEQYLWVHRRFKAVRPGDPDPYEARAGE
ncbi:MAG: LpxL/LpxP family Kdo(2)-lipid IV(A) lauroyl/palmitoleoyl acyltransferase [Gammaproteobacteria bacterium]|nr:LpxL/LpxP family Kdo(2)-lipid IV(A) lauroyl/palmitoleoyl acyltransferase [Gammaproteobacteria bacterium]